MRDYDPELEFIDECPVCASEIKDIYGNENSLCDWCSTRNCELCGNAFMRCGNVKCPECISQIVAVCNCKDREGMPTIYFLEDLRGKESGCTFMGRGDMDTEMYRCNTCQKKMTVWDYRATIGAVA